ncbi:WD G-beta repeat-containing protein protein, putative [Babesia ovis]|uniref:WD G-beta repeat-containing protein protein, putative n=1 Tax=Babesia ovis TaxID=5869 RepID=A0A9W5TA37_BABOV|nr:WD G-beta repeat-containing protein protein, putative [Babesia ovis]
MYSSEDRSEETQEGALPDNRNEHGLEYYDAKEEDDATEIKEITKLITKKKRLSELLSTLEMGNIKNITLSHCHKCLKKHRHDADVNTIDMMYDELRHVSETEVHTNMELENIDPTTQRESAYFNKTGDVHEHYLKHFAKNAYAETQVDDDTTDETDTYTDETQNLYDVNPTTPQEKILKDHNFEHNKQLNQLTTNDDLESPLDEKIGWAASSQLDNIGEIIQKRSTTPDFVRNLDGMYLEEEGLSESDDEMNTTSKDDYLDKYAMTPPTAQMDDVPSDKPMDGAIEIKEPTDAGGTKAQEVFQDDLKVPRTPSRDISIPTLSLRSLSENEQAVELDESLELRRSGAKEYVASVKEEDEVKIEEVEIAKELHEHTTALINDGRPTQSPAKTESITAMQLSDSKSLLAVGTLRGSITLFQTIDKNAVVDAAGVPTPPETKTNGGMRDAMLWAVMTKKALVSVEAHIGALHHICIIELDDSGDKMAHVFTAGDDSYVRIWALRKKDGQCTLSLIGAQYTAVEPVAALAFPNGEQVLLALSHGRVDYWEVTHNKYPPVHVNLTMTMTQTKTNVDTRCEILNIAISPSGKMFAVESTGGWLMLYDSVKGSIIGVADCRNRRGKWSNGANVNGVQWNKRENIILVTTADNRIRLLTTKPFEEDELLDLEKFKGHKNEKLRMKAVFAGEDEEYIVCPSEDQFICVWKHNVDPARTSFDEDDLQPTNTRCIKFKYNDTQAIRHICIFNPGEWKHIRQMIMMQQRKSGIECTEMPRSKCSCLPFMRKYTKAESINVSSLDTTAHILIAAPRDDTTLRYSLIATDTLKAFFRLNMNQ